MLVRPKFPYLRLAASTFSLTGSTFSVETMRLLDLFLPRIYHGKAAQNPAPKQETPNVDPTGFLYVKRDLVRLLGVLAHESRPVQDRTRNAGGIPIVMNLCVIDERNPCMCKSVLCEIDSVKVLTGCRFFSVLREHALFTLHNLLKKNAENQAVVDAVRPMGEFSDETGELKNRFGALKI